jgi:hypothetical protein
MRLLPCRDVIIGAFLIAVFACVGCASHYSRDQIGFWDQEVTFTGWGFTMATPYGPFNFGYLQWQRNIEKNLTPAKPSDALKATIR